MTIEASPVSETTGCKRAGKLRAAEIRASANLDVRRQLPCPVGDNYLDRLTDM